MAYPRAYLYCLTIDDFSDVYMCCESVKVKWETLATNLKVYRPIVEEIEGSEKDLAKCLRKVLSAWLKRSSTTQPMPSWRSLCDALAGMGQVALSERIQRKHPCGCGLCQVTNLRATPISMAVQQEDAVNAANGLKKEFDNLMDILVTEASKIDIHRLRYKISNLFYEEGTVSDEIEKHLTKIEDYDTPNAVLNYFRRHGFVGYINYSLVKVFQALLMSPSLDKCIEEYEKDYQDFLKLSLAHVHDAFQQCPDLRPDYPAGIPKFTVHLESEWNGKCVYELKELLKQCFNNSDCIDQLMIAKISRNCFIVTFAVLPHITQTVLQYLADDDVISTLQKKGITVNISKQLMKCQEQKTTEDIETTTDSTFTTELPDEWETEQDLQDELPRKLLLAQVQGDEHIKETLSRKRKLSASENFKVVLVKRLVNKSYYTIY